MLTQEGRSLVDDVCECVHLKGEEGLNRREQLGRASLLGVAYCLA